MIAPIIASCKYLASIIFEAVSLFLSWTGEGDELFEQAEPRSAYDALDSPGDDASRGKRVKVTLLL